MRPEFRLGSLYDRRTDNLLPGFTLWKEDSYKKEGFISERLASNQQWLIDSENTFKSVEARYRSWTYIKFDWRISRHQRTC